MTKEEYRAHTKFELIKLNKRLYKNVCRLIRQKIELREQIADIKANCDLAIEGRDIKIMELEKEVEKHKWNDIFLEDCAGYDKKIAEEYSTLQERNNELEQQIEKMKCCGNCKYNSYWGDELHCNYGLKEALQEDKLVECKDMDKWEIKE